MARMNLIPLGALTFATCERGFGRRLRNILVTLALLFGCSLSAFADRWVPMSKADANGKVVYLDVRTVEQRDDALKCRCVLSSPGTGEDYKARESFQIVIWKDRTWSVPDSDEVRPIKPGSAFDTVYIVYFLKRKQPSRKDRE